jgi:hypothetical protein
MHLKTLGPREHNDKKWEVLFHSAFLLEFRQLPEPVRRQVYALIELIAAIGPQLGRPHVDTLNGSIHKNMKELRFQVADGVWRVAFAFDIKRRAILLVAGDKSRVSKRKFYSDLIEIADRRFDEHQKEAERGSGG